MGRPLRFSDQLLLELEESPPQNADDLRTRLRRLGLGAQYSVRLTRNRTVVVSYGAGELRIHHSYLNADEEVWRAIILFVHGRTRAVRHEARRRILQFPIERAAPRPRRPPRSKPADEPLTSELAAWHARYNAEHFGGCLREIPIRLSRRMKSRLGHYAAASPNGNPAEIVISLRHIRRHGWDEALHTLLHEMVHQWQDEQGDVVDHGREFRDKARAVGITPSACRAVA